MKTKDDRDGGRLISRRTALVAATAVAAAPFVSLGTATARPTHKTTNQTQAAETMTFVTTKDGTQIFYKD